MISLNDLSTAPGSVLKGAGPRVSDTKGPAKTAINSKHLINRVN